MTNVGSEYFSTRFLLFGVSTNTVLGASVSVGTRLYPSLVSCPMSTLYFWPSKWIE